MSVRLATWLSRRRPGLLPIATVGGFVVRLTLFAIVLVVLGLWTPLNILATCLAFVGLFTVLNGVSLFLLALRHRGAPPSTGATGAS
jgi:hypothetical protein